MDIRRSVGRVLFVVGIAFAAFTFIAALFTARGGLVGLALTMQLLLPAALAAAIILVGWRLSHPTHDPVEAPRVRPTPVPAVPAGDLADIPEPVSACPDCGFLGIRMPTIGDGLWPGGGETGDRMVCPRCDWQGLPARFEKREDYGSYLRELSGSAPSSWTRSSRRTSPCSCATLPPRATSRR